MVDQHKSSRRENKASSRCVAGQLVEPGTCIRLPAMHFSSIRRCSALKLQAARGGGVGDSSDYPAAVVHDRGDHSARFDYINRTDPMENCRARRCLN